MRTFGMFFSLLMLASCADVQQGVTAFNAAAVQDVKNANDDAVMLWAESGCALPYGAVVRNASTSPGIALAIPSLCGRLPGLTMSVSGTTSNVPAVMVTPTPPVPAQ